MLSSVCVCVCVYVVNKLFFYLFANIFIILVIIKTS